MISERISAIKFKKEFCTAGTDVFITTDFNELNRYKVDDIIYLSNYLGTSLKAGFIFGKKNDWLFSPFSAPYGGLVSDVMLPKDCINEVARNLADFCRNLRLNCRITFPAPLVNDIFTINNLMLQESLLSHGFRLEWTDCNQNIVLTDEINFDADVLRRLKKGNKEGLKFQRKELTETNLNKVYDVIKRNHDELGYSMNMTLQAFMMTSKIVPIYLFTVEKNNDVLAGAICYQTRKDLMQLICWGDEVSKRKIEPSMPKLGHDIIIWLKEKRPDFKVLDMGPSSYHGQLNPGLIYFKKSLGCVSTLKNTLVMENVKI